MGAVYKNVAGLAACLALLCLELVDLKAELVDNFRLRHFAPATAPDLEDTSISSSPFLAIPGPDTQRH